MSQASSVLNSELLAAIECGHTILAPTRRASYQLKLSYAQHAIANGRSAWRTPSIVAFETWTERLWRMHAHRSHPIRVLSDQQAQLVWDRIIRESKWSESLLNPQAASRSSFRSWQRMIGWQISRDDLSAYVGLSDADESAALLVWHDAFLAMCTKHNWLPSALLPERLLMFPSLTTETIVTVESQELRPIELAVLQHAAKTGATWQRLSISGLANQTVVIEAENITHEFALAAQWADRQWLDGNKAIGIVVSDLDTHAKQIERAFNEVFAPTNRTLGAPLTSPLFSIAANRTLNKFPVVRAAIDILSLCAGRASSTLAGSVLRNPYIGESEQEAGSRALADKNLRAQTREYYNLANLERIASTSGCVTFSERTTTAQNLLRELPTRALPSTMAASFVAIWQALGWPGEQTLTSDEQQVISRLRESLGEFGALDELLGPMTFAVAVREFEQLATSIPFAPRVLPTPVNIVDANMLDGLQFDALWITGMEATRWPPPPEPDSLIPIELQIRAAMPFATARRTRELSAERFAQLCSIAPSVTMSWPRSDGDIELSQSPWLKALPSEKSSTSPSQTYSDKLLQQKPHLEVIKEASAPPISNPRMKGGSRIFELQSLCPFRAQAELRLAAHPLDEVVPSIDARDRGTLIHAALADIWRELRGSDELRARTTEQLEAMVRTTLSRHLNPMLEGATPYRVRMLQIEVELAAERILQLLKLDGARREFRVVGHPETAERVRVGELDVELRLDRMDEVIASEQRDALRIVIDYKTGSTIESGGWFASRPSQPQLPLYAVTHSEKLGAVAFATVSAKSVGYFGVSKEADLLPNVREFDDKKLPAPHVGWDGLLNYWHEVITNLANGFARGEAAVDPSPNACRYCHLSTLCRVNELENPELRAARDEASSE